MARSTACYARRPALEPCDDGIDGRKLRHHPALDGLDVEIAENRIDLSGHEVRRHQMDAADTARILSGQRRDHRSALDAERRERLPVGLDPGTRRGIRTADAE